MNEAGTYDVIVVGAGPGGLSFGMHAARSGLNVLILERGNQIGEKNASGCALSPKCWMDLEFMKGLLEQVPSRIARRATLHFIGEDRREEGSISFSPSKRFAKGSPERDFLTVNVYRPDLDGWLAGLARDAGAKIETGALVTEVKVGDGIATVTVNDDRKITAPLVIGADGAISLVSSKMGIRRDGKWDSKDLALMLTVDFEAEEGIIDALVGDQALHYYYGANFPIAYSFFNKDGFHVGLGHYIGWFLDQDISPIACIEELLNTPAIQRLIAMLDAKPREFQAHVLPFVSKPTRLFGDGFMLLGDAAGLICPLEAEGVYYAMLAGKIAAEVASDALRAKRFDAGFLSTYDQRIKKSPIGREFSMGGEWKEFIDKVPFNLDASKWVVPLLSDAMFAAINVNEAHADTVKHAHARVLELARVAYPKVKELAAPILTSLLDEFLGYYIKKLNLSFMLKPLLNSTKQMRSKMITQVLDEWLSSRSGYRDQEDAISLPPLSERINKYSKVSFRNIIQVDPAVEDFLFHDLSKCTHCASCALICPVKLWRKQDERVHLEENYKNHCLECGACFLACPEGAVNFAFPGDGKGVKYERG
ncbi:FAD-dependent oxidoreductase [Candidatus Bathyarchaeota archaeon]|nr:FAD-dependent oxidoreductase [Candidatus Bathyarchaeota archaeon]